MKIIKSDLEPEYTIEELLKCCTPEKMQLTEEDHRWLWDEPMLPDTYQ